MKYATVFSMGMGRIDFPCSECDHFCRSMYAIKLHCRVKHPGFTLKVGNFFNVYKICNKKFKEESDLITHARTNHSNTSR